MTDSLLTNFRLRPYLDDVRQWHGYVRFLGLPTMVDNPDTPLSELFVTPALSDQRVAPEAPPDGWPSGHSVLSLLEQRRRLVVLGDPGCGKSTVSNWIAWLLAGGADGALPAALDGLLPLPMVARELKLDAVNGFNDLLDAFLDRPVAEQLRAQRSEVLALLAAGRCAVLVDGLDEVPVHRRNALRDALRDGAKRFPDVVFLVTSRIVGYDGCALQEPPPKTLAVKLDTNIAERLTPFALAAEQMGLAAPWSTVYVMPFDDARIESFASQWYALRGIRHIARQDASQFLVAVHHNPSIEALARMPQLLTLMALVFKVGTRLPDGRAILYEQIAEAYLRSIDDARRVERGSDESGWEEKRRWLARIGFEMQLLRGRAKQSTGEGSRELLVSRTKILKWVGQAMKQSGYPADAEFAARDLDWVARRSGLLLPRGEDLFAFVHLSFQEYFAALYLVEHLADVDWVMAQRDGTTYREADRRVSAPALGNWARSALWQEVFVFASETFANKPRDARRLADWLFGVDLKNLSASMMELQEKSKHEAEEKPPGFHEAQRAELLARLATNPHSGWLPQDRDRGLKLLLRYVQRTESVFGRESVMSVERWRLGRPVLRRLLANDEGCKVFWRWIESKQPDNLELQMGGQVRLSKMPVLSKLESLAVDSVNNEPLIMLATAATELTQLFIDDASDLSSLEGIERCKKLRVLSLAQLTVNTIEPIGQLVGLESLEIRSGAFSDVSSLAGLKQLRFLDFSFTSVENLEPLRLCTSLTRLYAYVTTVSSLEPLVDLPNLDLLVIPNGIEVPKVLEGRAEAGRLRIHRI